MKKVCVIGAGPSGLTTIKQLMDEGHEPICYEKASDLGGVFNYSETHSSVYANAMLTISNYMMAFSDYPPTGHRHHWHHSEYKQYLKRYVDHFNLQDKIQYNTAITHIRRQENGYKVTIQKVQNPQETDCQYFDAVAVCIGANQIKKSPVIPGLQQFKGELIHASDYKTNERFRDRQVVCIGIGESSADITREISEIAKSCHLAIRSYPNLIPRILNTSSSDGWTTRVIHGTYEPSEGVFPFIVGFMYFQIMVLMRTLWKFFAGERALEPELDAFGQPTSTKMLDLSTKWEEDSVKLVKAWGYLSGARKFATKNVSFVPNILNGKIQVNASGIQKIDGDTVVFNDGRSVQADTIVACTGYQDSFDLIEGFQLEENNIRNLFLHAFHPNWPNLAFIGWARPVTGGNPACAEMTARYFARLLSDQVSLPDDIQERIKSDKEFYAARVRYSSELSSLVEWKRYMETIAELLGCKVTLWKYMWRPLFFLKLMYGSLVPCQYRLEGPYANFETSKRVILRLPITMQPELGRYLSTLIVQSELGLRKDSPSDYDRYSRYEYLPEYPITDQDIEKYRFVAKSPAHV